MRLILFPILIIASLHNEKFAEKHIIKRAIKQALKEIIFIALSVPQGA